MNPVILVLFSIIFLFTLFLVVKQITNWKICAICASVSITWSIFLVLFWLGLFPHPILIGILMGQSIIGVFYLLEKKLKEQWHIFRLPFLLTAYLIVVLSLGELTELYVSVLLIAIVWLLFIFLYLAQTKPYMKKVVMRIVECCKNW